ncbi:relaxase/mobilization nuclease domain-containing protein, partial [Dyadobacter sp. CY312]|uniref:relaxase/mobilization nuclease domain-containing protein n=1 Tax=Dyadobacter sp. CY312 TaxID=2907303 RepID=UPI001F41CF07
AAVYYNENKISQGTAACILAYNYPADADDLTATQRLNMLLKISAMNQNVKRNSIHISLNFHPSEALSKTRLNQIAQQYMKQIGFGAQPFLVYQHHDAAHPHVHIVSTIVRRNGQRIDILNIGRNQSEKARKQIELDYGLLAAQGKSQQQQLSAQRIQYGKQQTVAAISAVLNAVLPVYRYGSLSELNAVLGQYNVSAQRGTQTSETFRRRGLVYRILDSEGKMTGAPVKASSIPGRPTLSYLEKRFEINQLTRQVHGPRLRSMIDLKLLRVPDGSLRTLTESLDKEGIKTVVRQNKQGLIADMIYVDFKTKSVFTSSDLGRAYTPSAILDRCAGRDYDRRQIPVQVPRSDQGTPEYNRPGPQHPGNIHSGSDQGGSEHNLDLLFEPLTADHYLPWQLRKTRKRKHKRLNQQL